MYLVVVLGILFTPLGVRDRDPRDAYANAETAFSVAVKEGSPDLLVKAGLQMTQCLALLERSAELGAHERREAAGNLRTLLFWWNTSTKTALKIW